MTIDHEAAFLDALNKIGTRKEEDAVLEKDADGERVTATVSTRAASAVSIRNLFKHPEAHAIVLDSVLLDRYGPEWLLWEPETLQVTVQADFGHTLSDLNLSKLQACKTLHLVDTFWENWEVFLWCCMPLNDEFPDFEVLQVPTVAQCAVAVDVAGRIRKDTPWSKEVKTFWSVVYRHEGLFVPIAPLDDVGLEVPEGLDVSLVRKKFEEAKRTRIHPPVRAPEDGQVLRLLVVHEYLEENSARVEAQLKAVSRVA